MRAASATGAPPAPAARRGAAAGRSAAAGRARPAARHRAAAGAEPLLLRLGRRRRLRVVGLMSGTSADAIDAAVVELRRAAGGLRQTLLAFHSLAMPPSLRRQVLRLCLRSARVEELCQANMALGEAFAQGALAAIAASGLTPQQIDLIGSHGQTVRHLPAGDPPSTLQIGEPAVIAQRTGIVTVADFRPADMAAGGQGAPLVPAADRLLFAHPRQARLILNIGGIANVTVLPPAARPEDVVAFDLGPGNAPLDAAVQQLTGGRRACDSGGALARQGAVDRRLLDELLRHPFLHRPPPKSTGREEFGAEFVRGLLRRWRLSPADMLATLTEFTAAAIAHGLRAHVLPRLAAAGLWVAGGGLRNPELMRRLGQALPELRVASTAELGVPPEAREAIAFAVLAAETAAGRPGNVTGATGARRPVVLGKIVPP